MSESDITRQFRMDFSREYEVQWPLTSFSFPNQLYWDASLLSLKIAVRSSRDMGVFGFSLGRSKSSRAYTQIC